MANITDISRVDIDKLIPYINNAKQHTDEQITRIASSIREFGFVNPVLIDKEFNIIAGHGRVMAAKKLGLAEVPCVYVEGLTEAQRKAYILADNRLGELAEWDMDIVTSELEALQQFDFDIDLTGFELPDEEDDAEVVEDEVPDVPEEPVTKLGDLWQLGEHRLICGDSTDVNVVDMLTNGANPDVVLTDPPYGINAVSNNGEVGADFGIAKKGKYAKIIADDTTETAQQAYDLLSQICDKLILWGGNYFLDFLPPSDGWLIWDKRGESGIKNTFADGELAWCSFHTPVRIYHQLWNGMIREGEHEKRVHPTQKPVRMLSEILKDFTSERDAVLDVFGGSGSTLIACEQLNRRCYMSELDPHYCDVIIQRWEKLTGKKAVLING